MGFIMKKSIISRYFAISSIIMVSSVIIIGLFFLIFASNFYKREKHQLLYDNSIRMSKLATSVIESSEPVLDRLLFDNYVEIILQSINGYVYLTDINGNNFYRTKSDFFVDDDFQVSNQILNEVDSNGIYSQIGDMNGIYNKKVFTIGIPVLDRNNNKIGYLFTYIDIQMQRKIFLNDMIGIYCLSCSLVLAVAFIIIYILSKKIANPLKLMSDAAYKFGKGDFHQIINVQSDDEIGKLATSLNEMAKSLSSGESTRRSFIANISHELKTPMTSISGFVDGILDGTIPQEKQRYYLEIVSEEVKRLSRLVKSMLNLSRFESGEMDIKTKKVDIVDIVCQTLFSFEKQIENKGLKILGLTQNNFYVDVDSDLIHQVIYNLTENAVKFTNDDGYISFDFNSDGEKTIISIKNSGEGLTKEEKDKIFDKFYKTDRSRGMDKNGLGLGLYIVKSILRLHDSAISVDSKESEYTEFKFYLKNISSKYSNDKTQQKLFNFKKNKKN